MNQGEGKVYQILAFVRDLKRSGLSYLQCSCQNIVPKSSVIFLMEREAVDN